MSAFQSMPTKRRRDPDSDSEEEPFFKKYRPVSFERPQDAQTTYPPTKLPLRSSITPSPPRLVSDIEAMTPAQSIHSEANSPMSIPNDSSMLSSPQQSATDFDMDMDEDVCSQPPESPFTAPSQFMRPAKLNSDLFGRDSPVNNTGRIPTPIYPNFNGGAMSGLAYPSSGLAGGMSMSNGYSGSSSSTNPIMQPPPPSRKQTRQIQDELDRSRRMPSPISEDEDIPDTPTALTQSQLSRLSVTTQGHGPEHMDSDPRHIGVPPTPRGRKRSGALTGMGRFSMGYRDDCEKCRLRVPGHYSHFLS